MFSKKILLIAYCLSIIFLLGSGVDAYQKKMTVKECIFSYNDDEFNAWDEAEQTGVFLKINNNNLVLGETQNPDYEYIVYQPARTYYNNFNYGGTSTIPYLKVRASNEENKVYTKCNYKVGDYRIFFASFYHNYGCHGAYLTHDFDLTQDIVTEGMTGYSYSFISQYNNIASPYSRYFGASAQSRSGGVFYVDNKVDSDHPSSILYNNGFYPNTEPTVTTVMDMDNLAPSILSTYSLIRENGHQLLFSYFDNWFYIDSDMQDARDMLKPRATSQTFKNENTGATPLFVANHGDNISAAFTFKNDFEFPLNNIELYQSIYSELVWAGGVGAGTDVHGFNIYKIEAYNFSAEEEKTVYHSSIIPENSVFPHLRGYYRVRGSSPYSDSYPGCPLMGSDEVNYLGFLRFDPRIEIKKMPEGIYQPIFNLEVELFAVDSYAYDYTIKPNEYALLAELYINDEKVDNFTIILDEDEFAKMGKTELTKGSITNYNLIIPIKKEYSQSGGKCYIQLYSVKLTEPFKDKKIARITKLPYFKAGDIAYSYDDKLNFGLNSQIDSEKIILFNPTFYENDIELNVESWSDENNFMLSWDGEHFSKNPSKTFHLYPLQSKDISFWVNATYNPWVSSSIQENLKINVKSDLKTTDGFITKNENLSFILNLDKGSLNWFNIKPANIDPEVIYLDTVNSTKNKKITLNWNLEGSDSRWGELIGNSYDVEVKLINGTDPTGEVLKETNATFNINKNETTEITFDFDFSYGEYIAVLDLDSNNQIAELFSSGENAEEDNSKIFQIPFLVTYCYYNEDGYMHRINFFGEDVIDKENKCECPPEFLTIPDEGYCADPYDLEGCLTFVTHLNCNDWEQSKPRLCGWESRVSPSVNPGDCLSCNNISNTCSGYNNEETCEIDPCYKALSYDCPSLNCDKTQEYGCKWDTSFNKCNFYSITNGNSCSYFGNMIQECNGTNDKMIINYTSNDPGCEDATREVICGQDATALNFFTWLNFIFAIILITIFYIAGNKKRRKK
ncbi:MAG: hypothetical protein U9Q73_03250 [Nanoarchaeota archaeon]|nr:hypothetical protein [Nanoarchaeota archaeon]